MTPQATALGELAMRLQADVAGSVRDRYCDMFRASQLAGRRRMHEPLAPEEHERSEALARGAGLACEVIASVWRSLHS